ncbi:MAG TPA: GNAT family N-acetyltransferase [Gammaproteobacteria bacterium]|nr:GNAT family N-acetyltransferase [Gammaproteobacteria bacterium]
MIKQLTKVSRLHKTDLRNITTLADRSADHDGFKIKIYWHIIENRLTMEFNDFFYYLDGNLVAYLALYTFENDEAELSVVVHPKFRQRGIFKKLMAEAILELKQRHLTHCVWIRPQRSPITDDYLRAMGGQYDFSQVEMMAVRDPVPKELPTIIMREADTQDLITIARMGAVSFNSSFTETLQRFTENMQEKNRLAWLVSTPDYENVGKIHVRYDENNAAFIHDLCIVPEHRGKNLATAMILQTMHLLRQRGQRVITLDVECHNIGALRLYQQCGFDTIAAFDFWRVPVDRM